ncbi:hypothetical protein [Achromobacter insolitus]|uniref:hypothetical protein n=2 Tax=Achromobacter TaxID=222 RepID=UPI003B99680B
MRSNRLAKVTLATTFVALLSACSRSDQEPPPPRVRPAPPALAPNPFDEAESNAKTLTRSQLANDEVELKAELARLQATDPTVKDLYYGTDAEGNRVVHVVQQRESDSTATTSSFSAGNMMLGMLIGHMLSSGSVSNYANSHPPVSKVAGQSPEDQRRSRNLATGAHATAAMQRNRSYATQNPAGASAMARAAQGRPSASSSPSSPSASTHSSSAFRSSAPSARAGGYSGGS